MRIISGTKKGLSLKAVPGKDTRPTTDKVKESIFNMIGPYFDGGIALDLFAGSGGLGIEALSRGFERVIFVDRDMKAIQTVKENLRASGFSDAAEVYRNEAERALKAVLKREIVFDGIFLDPPYQKQKLESMLQYIGEQKMLSTGGFIMCEHGANIVLPDAAGPFERVRFETYGIISISIYKWAIDGEE
ncbi:16S rRNA (guanine(966)-N(2))-methyltransferase RsmD [Domibacillus epiphyticus]|uniref:16S rRNA (Guanine(966)-N(2))-methyltransferase RsmD n=1 Tax=Domibacillus epiphyticus TaxID=1714355 RepID=A0A1V2ACI3_9BACI|nr:16S rRNA (guanine(966)-N(2))-methyltransferase RsmD [Domibacillus epiphyticus]OMP68504.1 16S rRNA (guanine(966)-N(2))-methyltransferase RsmD [Domibacillus epiphyticus]